MWCVRPPSCWRRQWTTANIASMITIVLVIIVTFCVRLPVIYSFEAHLENGHLPTSQAFDRSGWWGIALLPLVLASQSRRASDGSRASLSIS